MRYPLLQRASLCSAVAFAALLAACAPEANTHQSDRAVSVDTGEDALISQSADHPGNQVYETYCAACHNEPENLRIPRLSDLKVMNPMQVKFALTNGKMKQQAAGLSRAELNDLLKYLSPESQRTYEVPASAFCKSDAIDFENIIVGSWGVTQDNGRYFSPDKTSLTAENVRHLELVWAVGMPGASDMRSYPVVTGDTLFTASSAGHMFAIDRNTGCIKWHRNTEKSLRTAVSIGKIGGKPALFVMDLPGRVYAFRAEDGDLIWSAQVGLFESSMGTGGLVPAGDKLIVPMSNNDAPRAMDPNYECCKGHGSVHALNIETGEVLWTAHMTPEAQPTTKSSVGTQQWGPSGAPVWATPAVDPEAGRIYVGTGENTSAPGTQTSDALIALDLETGKQLWVYQALAHDTWNMACSAFRPDGPNCPDPEGPDFDFGGGVTLATLSDGRKVVVGGQKSGDVHVVDANNGELIWTRKLSAGSALGGVHWGVSVSSGKIFAPAADPEFPIDPAVYDPKPGLDVLDLDTGEILWSYRAERGCDMTYEDRALQTSPWPECSFSYGFSATPATTDELAVIGALDGRLFVFNADTGEVIWSFNTKRAFDSTNGVDTHGGAIDNAGPFMAGDMLYVQSGYSGFSQMPGNALLAFRVGKGN